MKKKETLKRSIFRILTIVCAACLLLSMVALNTSAVSYSGSGTKADPYIVETPEQLNGMRDNLSAHYKLGNTIDMSKFGKFIPIGWQGTAFTGSFVCDANSDGAPKYAIKNLTVYNDAGEKYGHKTGSNAGYVDFKQGACKWQAGLFGWTKGATITNIAILNADVTNTVVGQNNMNKDWSLNPGQGDEQGTGALIGVAESTTISGCMSSGKINSKSNATGGLIGRLDEASSIAYSYSKTTVTSSGYWNTGGLVGTCQGSMSCCFATGDVKGGATEPTTGSLCGGKGETSTVSSCYATGKVLSDSNGHNFIGFDNGKDVPDGMYYCYFTGSVKGYSSFDNAGVEAAEQNLYALKGASGRQSGFTVAAADKIKKTFSSSADWDTRGKLPTLKKIHIIEDEAKYVPGAVSNPAPDNTSSATPSQEATSSQTTSQTTSQGATSSNAGNATQSEATSSVVSGTASQSGPTDVAALVEKMNALPIEDDVKLEHYETIREIRQQYEALNADQVASIPVDAVKKYNAALAKIIPIVMADITKQVNELPDVKKLSSKDYETIMALKEKLAFIGDNVEFMEETVTEKLNAAIAKAEELGADSKETSSGKITLIEWALIGVICLFIVCALTVEVIWTYSVCKRTKSLKSELETEE
ncbi:MAG: hypothetical protein IJP22_02105 [Clostridia bacterium]|nr:hypothetical protein [Clostridia bacterium]